MFNASSLFYDKYKKYKILLSLRVFWNTIKKRTENIFFKYIFNGAKKKFISRHTKAPLSKCQETGQ